MSQSLCGRSLLTLLDTSPEEIVSLLDLADTLKSEKARGVRSRRFEGKTLALLFEKRSTRTRCAFETAFGEEGGHPVFLSNQDIHLGAKESLEDTARVLGRMFDCIQFRGYSQNTVQTLAEYSGVPVYNGLTDSYHPTQALADLQTLRETTEVLKGSTVVYMGDGRNNVARSLLIGCSKLGVHITICCPHALSPDKEIIAHAERFAAEAGGGVQVLGDPEEALPGADAVYTDVWVSMGEESQESERLELLKPYRVTDDTLELTGNERVIFLHCLPAVRGNEVTDSVMDGARSRVWDQAENRKHTIKAVIAATLG